MKQYVYQGAFYPYVNEEYRTNNFVYNFTNASALSNNDTLGHFVPKGTLNHIVYTEPGAPTVDHIERIRADIVPPTLVMRFKNLELVPITTEGDYNIYHIVSDPHAFELYVNLAFEMDIAGNVVKIAVDNKDVLVHPNYNPAFEYERIERSLFYTYYGLGEEENIEETIIPCMLFLSAGKKYSILYLVRKSDGRFILGYKDAAWGTTFTDPWFKDIQLLYVVQCTDLDDEVYCNLRYSVPDLRSVIEQFRAVHSTYHSLNDIRTLSVSR